MIDHYKYQYEISPIVLVNGVAGAPGAKVPIINFTEGGKFAAGATSPPDANSNLDDFFAHFVVEASSTLIDNDVAHWPLANQAVAANTTITKPLSLALVMICPAKSDMSIQRKQALMISLQGTLSQHINLGGTFDVATPAYLYTGLLLLRLSDVSQVSPGGQVQLAYRWEFEQPLLTDQQALVVYNTGMNKFGNGTRMHGDPPTANPAPNAVGNPASNVAQNVVPSARPLNAAGLGGANAGAMVNFRFPGP